MCIVENSNKDCFFILIATDQELILCLRSNDCTGVKKWVGSGKKKGRIDLGCLQVEGKPLSDFSLIRIKKSPTSTRCG